MTVTTYTPASGEQDVVLGRTIELTFDQPVDPATLSTATFLLRGPGGSSLVDADETVRTGPIYAGENITGTFEFPAPDRAVFVPQHPLRPNVEYTVLVVGYGSVLAKSYIKADDGTPLAPSVQWKFRTGELAVAPPQSPVEPVNSWERPALVPSDVLIRPLPAAGGSTTRQIELRFPGAIKLSSFQALRDQIVIALEPLLNDPQVVIPVGVVSTVTLSSPNTLLVSIEVPS